MKAAAIWAVIWMLLTSYQGICGTAVTDARHFLKRVKVFIQFQIPQASFEWLYGDVMSLEETNKGN